jgi:membrane-associated protease RseP (regulator of RpoE activity)
MENPMLTVRSLAKLFVGIALAATCICFASRLHADDDPPVSDPQPAPQSDEKAHVQGRIIIVEPDGTRREYSFGPQTPQPIPAVTFPRVDVVMPRRAEDALRAVEVQTLPRVHAIRALIHDPQVIVSDYMIGLDCVEADAALRAQLGLGEKGLVVRSPLEKSPAAEAGLQSHDVLTKAGDKDLANVQDLLDAVQATEGKPLTITLLRGGKEQTLEVTPVKRMDVTLPPPGADPKDIDVYIRKRLEHSDGVRYALPHTLRMRAVQPGVVFDHIEVAGPDKLKDIETQLQNLKQQVETLQHAISELKEKQN